MPVPRTVHTTQTPTPSARAHALAVLRIRGTALALALLPAAVAVVLHTAAGTWSLGPGWDALRWAVTALAVVTLCVTAGTAAVIARARPAVSPTVPVERSQAPDLYTLVRHLAERLDVPVPSAIALTPDCDSWLEDRTHPAQEDRTGDRGGPRWWPKRGRSRTPPVLVIGSPFLWWMRVAELRALLAPVVAGTGPSAHPDISAARRCVRGLDAAVALADRARAGDASAVSGSGIGILRRAVLRFTGVPARVLLRACGPHAAEMERGVAAAAADRAQHVDRALRTTAQEQVGLAYAGWDRLLTRVALPAWQVGRWPSRLDAGVVAALTDLSRRDRLADGFASRLEERPACDLLEEPGAADAAISLLAARLFHGEPRPASDGSGGWSPVDWPEYPEEVVDRTWRIGAARLFTALDADRPPTAVEHGGAPAVGGERVSPSESAVTRIIDRLSAGAHRDALAARLVADVAREEAARDARPAAAGPESADGWQPSPMGLPLRPPRTGRELLAEHITAAVCCAALDTADAAAGLDWLDGPVLLVRGERVTDLAAPVRELVEDGDPESLRLWLSTHGIRADKPVRLV
ncbi:hypothetical protein [Streptomyces sp. TR06-5]|uniref:hypothetical protein n=1 Tax=Streptomyces sp. TR06-5 TaxID=3385976 RepID=UPI00399F777C